MSIPYWRLVSESSHDYIFTYQCLNCYNQFNDMSSKWKFCPYCATEWKGQHPCILAGMQHIPHTVDDEGNIHVDRKYYEREKEICYRLANENLVWVIEELFQFSSVWRVVDRLYDNAPAKEVLKALKWRRENDLHDGMTDIYRARYLKEKDIELDGESG